MVLLAPGENESSEMPMVVDGGGGVVTMMWLWLL